MIVQILKAKYAFYGEKAQRNMVRSVYYCLVFEEKGDINTMECRKSWRVKRRKRSERKHNIFRPDGDAVRLDFLQSTNKTIMMVVAHGSRSFIIIILFIILYRHELLISNKLFDTSYYVYIMYVHKNRRDDQSA